jgi:hypothetical protein
MKIIYHQYDDVESAFLEAEMRGFMLVHVEYYNSFYEVLVFSKDRLFLEIDESLSSRGKYVFPPKILLVCDGSIKQNWLETELQALEIKGFVQEFASINVK